ncbi:MAG: FtsX-like permease family protein [Gemmatimonadetes bacterium]|nr:FtsX-like permease family protein [Gemmatimonadota bacterium]
MRLPRGIRRLFRVDVLTSRVEKEIDDEIGHHFEEAVRAYRKAGLDEQEARVRARSRFGDERAYRQALKTIDRGRVGMRERSEWIDAWGRSLSFVWRGLRHSPGFTFSVVSILALGIGANGVMFGVVDRLLLSPPQHIVDADEVKLLHVRRIGFNGDVFTGSTITYPDLVDLQAVDAFRAVAGYTEPIEKTLGRGSDARQISAVEATASLFPLLGVEPFMGRFFTDDEDAVSAAPTVVLAHEFWERELGSDPSALGTRLEIDQGSYTVIGIAPPGFTGPQLSPVDAWVPANVSKAIENDGETQWREHRGWYWIKVVARLAPGAAIEAAAAEATAAHRGGRAAMISEDRYDEGAEVLVSSVIAARGPAASSESSVARWLAGVSIVVLIIACFNVANLLLARSMRRRRETAVRLALGVGRWQLVRDSVLESLVLAALGAAAAVVVGRSLGDAVHQALLPGISFNDTGLGGRLLVFTLAATLVTGLVTGLIPAHQSARGEPGEVLRGGARSGADGRSRLRAPLLLGQAALSVVLLVGAGLFVQSLDRARALDLGFDPDGLVVTTLEWNETLPADVRARIYDEVETAINRLPSVASAALTYTVPFRSSISLGQPRVPGRDSIPKHHSGGPYVNKVGAGYFETMGLSILEGRGIEQTDQAAGAPPVTVLSESMARAIWPDESAVGQCLVFEDQEDATCTQVVGVVENHRRQALLEDDHFLYYVNEGHPAFQGPPQALMVRLRSDDAGPGPGRLRTEARSVSSQIRFVGADPLTAYVEPQLRSWRLGASMFTVFGFLALVVAAWGLYSTLAFDVALRRHEIGVRSALGADRNRIVGLILRQAIFLAGAGIGIGLVVAAALAGYVEPLLFQISGRDPLTYAWVAATLLLTAVVAGVLPARRATRVDPREALQAD